MKTIILCDMTTNAVTVKIFFSPSFYTFLPTSMYNVSLMSYCFTCPLTFFILTQRSSF